MRSSLKVQTIESILYVWTNIINASLSTQSLLNNSTIEVEPSEELKQIHFLHN